MTPKETAQRIEDKFRTFVVMWTGGVEVENANVKQCASIVVDEIMNMDVWDNPMDETHYGLIFWKQVKEEIIKL